MRVGDARLLDRLVRGRAWIALIAVGLMGIVFMQVSLLKLNAGIGRAVTAADTFERQNSSLREDISKLDSGERIQAVAAKLGMVMPAAGDVHYLDGRGADGARAAARDQAARAGDADVPRRRRRRRRAGGDDDRARRPPRRRRPRRAPTAATARRRAGHDDHRAARDDHHRAGDDHRPRPRRPPPRTAPANTAPTATGPAAVAGGASAPQGGQG